MQEKLLSSQAKEEVRALKDRLTAHQRELESSQETLSELNTLREHISSLKRDNRNLQSKLEVRIYFKGVFEHESKFHCHGVYI